MPKSGYFFGEALRGCKEIQLSDFREESPQIPIVKGVIIQHTSLLMEKT